MLQSFEWYSQSKLYQKLIEKLPVYCRLGIHLLWLPPACRNKPFLGIDDQWHESIGYSPYDLWDLGEFDPFETGDRDTRFGSKEELIKLVEMARTLRIGSLLDVTFNHLAGAKETEKVMATLVDSNHRNRNIKTEEVHLFTKYDYLHRKGLYSNFSWNAEHFTASDYYGIWKLNNWNWEVDGENENFDYLMGEDMNHSHPAVRSELMNWGRWLNDTLHISGYRIDAAKHIQFEFQKEWLSNMKTHTGRNQFCVGEYYSYDLGKLENYLAKQDWQVHCFDFPLQLRFREASKDVHYDLRNLFQDTLTSKHRFHSITFVDNHDTQARGLGVYASKCVEPWFKPMAYAFILLRKEGYPCVFVGDLDGTNPDPFGGVVAIQAVEQLPRMLELRQIHNHGEQHTYSEDPNLIAWTREGLDDDTGLAVLITNGEYQTKELYVGMQHVGQSWFDAFTGKEVIINETGHGFFKVTTKSMAIYTPIKYQVNELIKKSADYHCKINLENPNKENVELHYRLTPCSNWQVATLQHDKNSDFSFITIPMGKSIEIEFAVYFECGVWLNNQNRNYVCTAGEFTMYSYHITDSLIETLVKNENEFDINKAFLNYKQWYIKHYNSSEYPNCYDLLTSPHTYMLDSGDKKIKMLNTRRFLKTIFSEANIRGCSDDKNNSSIN